VRLGLGLGAVPRAKATMTPIMVMRTAATSFLHSIPHKVERLLREYLLYDTKTLGTFECHRAEIYGPYCAEDTYGLLTAYKI
jgi:hypothetical protein